MKVIYKISNKTGPIYIGQTKNLKKRIYAYKHSNAKYHRKLSNSFNEYGFKGHLFEVLHELPDDVDQDIVDVYEKFYIEQYTDCGIELLNIREGGIRGRPAEETRTIW